MFLQKLFHAKKETGICVSVMSRAKIAAMIRSFPENACVISINTPGEGYLPFTVPVLYLDFPDIEDNSGISHWDAEKIAHFVMHNISNGNAHIFVHCDQGVTRSAGVAAAILRAYGKDESQILDCSDYCINSRCYEFVLKAFYIDVTSNEVLDAKQRSKLAYLKGWPTL